MVTLALILVCAEPGAVLHSGLRHVAGADAAITTDRPKTKAGAIRKMRMTTPQVERMKRMIHAQR